GGILDEGDLKLKDRVASLFESDVDTPTTIYSAMVSSQFDADRLDYMQRDRLMTGAKAFAIDLTWLLANLEIHKVTVGSDETNYDEVATLVLGEKAVLAGEGYVLALFHLIRRCICTKRLAAPRSFSACFSSSQTRRVVLAILRRWACRNSTAWFTI